VWQLSTATQCCGCWQRSSVTMFSSATIQHCVAQRYAQQALNGVGPTVEQTVHIPQKPERTVYRTAALLLAFQVFLEGQHKQQQGQF
jgi:hypothetical protein